MDFSIDMLSLGNADCNIIWTKAENSDFVTIIDGAVLTENIFSWPGMGQLILDSVLREDIPVAMATFSFIGITALIAHFIADISYAFLDPRIRIKSQG